MEPYLQKKAMTTFHYVQKDFATRQIRNYRWCSRSFASIEKTINYIAVKMYRRFVQMASHRTESNLVDNKTKSKTETMRSDFQKTADDIMLSKYSPVGWS
jgi:two-component system CheB/CheR fusion protein